MLCAIGKLPSGEAMNLPDLHPVTKEIGQSTGVTTVRCHLRCGAKTSPRFALVQPNALQDIPVMDVGVGGSIV